MERERFDAAVVGTGVVGLAAALGLGHQGLRVALIGPRPRPHAASDAAPYDARIYALAPGSAALLEKLAVWARLDQRRLCRVERMRVFGDAGDELTFDAYGAAVERLATIIEESELLRVLDAACDFQPSIVRAEQTFQQFNTDATDPTHLTVALNDGACSARLLVGADGGNSAVRAAAGISADAVSYDQTALVVNLLCERPHQNTAFQWFTDEGVVALLPLPGDRVSLVWSAPDSIAAQLRGLSPAELGERVCERTQHALGTLAPIGPLHGFPLRRIRVRRLIAERVALIGDAAHVVHPLAGQGLNLGLQDVDELLRAIEGRESFRSIGEPTVLRRYERARAESIDLMRWTTDGLARLFAIDDPLVRRARNAGMSVVDRMKPLKSRLIRQALG